MVDLVKKLQPRSWRTQKMHDIYNNERQADLVSDLCPLCQAPSVLEFQHWRIIANKYPYDSVAQTHHLLLIKDHVAEGEISIEAWEELKTMKNGKLNELYAFIFEALPKNKSVPGHFHLHLLVPKVID